MKRWIPLWLTLLILVQGANAAAQAPESDLPTAAVVAPQPSELALMAARIRDLMADRLSADVSVASLFEMTPGDQGPYGFDALLRHVADPKLKVARVAEESESERLQRELFEARLGFLRLPEARRQALIASHEARQQAALAQKTARQTQLTRLKQTRDDLLAMFDGNGPGSARSVLSVSALASDDLLLNPQRRAAYLGTPPSTADEITTLQLEIDGLRKRFWQGSPEQQALWLSPPPPVEVPEPEVAPEPEVDLEELERQRLAETEAARATREREAAMEAARTARTESLRLIAGEKARLLGIKEQYAKISMEFVDLENEIQSIAENALAASRQVKELQQRSVLDPERENDANKLYDSFVSDLSSTRKALHEVLTNYQLGQSRVPAIGNLAELPTQIDVPEITELNVLFDALRASQEALRTQESELLWKQATALRDAMVSVNEGRLELLSLIAPAKLEAVTGFGQPGVAQAIREFDQISLAARYHILALPRLMELEGDVFMASPVVLVWLIIKLIVLTSLFVWWRRRADELLRGWSHSLQARSPKTDLTQFGLSALWYLQHVRGPLEWLLFFWAISGSSAIESWPEIEFARIVLLWALLGSFVIRFVDAIAERQGDPFNTTQTDTLRVKSLRLVGVTVVAVGLTLSLTEASVGRGAIYVWVSSTAWIFAIPIAFLLTRWWRDTVFARARAVEHPNAAITWVATHETGLMGFAAAAFGGVYLLTEGLVKWAYVQVADLTTTRRLLAYLFRREVEKQASKSHTEAEDMPVSKALYDQFVPDLSDVPLENYMRAEIKEVQDLLVRPQGSVIAIMGERGLGKTAVMFRAVEEVPAAQRLNLSCGFGGLEELLAQWKSALQLEDSASIQAIADQISNLKISVVAIDDIHRLIRPVIGGLKEFDLLMDLVRNISKSTSVILTLDEPIWQYLRRARANQVVFDHMLILESWSEELIAEFIELRCSKLDVHPSFERFISTARGHRTLDQARLDFYRILWDYSRGNPSIAMHYWRESLITQNGSDQIYVRLFRPPGASQLSDIPNAHHFVLRTILQLEECSYQDILDCTLLNPSEIQDALRLAKHRHMIAEHTVGYRVNLVWYRAIFELLVRQHLLT